MKLKELKNQVDKLMANDLGDLEVMDENRIVLEQMIVEDIEGNDAAVMCHGQNPV